MDRAIAPARRSDHIAAVLFIGIDGFKAVNDPFRHQVGDELLVEVSRRLVALVPPGDKLARLGGRRVRLPVRKHDRRRRGWRPVDNSITSALSEPIRPRAICWDGSPPRTG